jgi:hypothetical protein
MIKALPDIVILKAWVVACNASKASLANDLCDVMHKRSAAWANYEHALSKVLP